MAEPIKLLPCPFCGGDLEVTKHFKEEIWHGIHRCPVAGPLVFDWRESVQTIADEWNRRAPLAPAADTLEALTARNAELEAALRLFASIAGRHDSDGEGRPEPGNKLVPVELALFRRARAILAPAQAACIPKREARDE